MGVVCTCLKRVMLSSNLGTLLPEKKLGSAV